MVALKPAVKDDKVNVEELEKIMVKAIGKEAERCRQSVDQIVNHTLFEILHNPIFSPSFNSSNLIHLFTMGSSSATYGVLSQLVSHFVTQSRWKLDWRGEREKTGLKITIGECRPLHEGVTLARKLNDLIKVYDPQHQNDVIERSTRGGESGAEGSKRPKRLESLDNFGYFESRDWYLDSKHQKAVEKFDTPLHLPPLDSQPLETNQDDGPVQFDHLPQQFDQSKRNQGSSNAQESEKIKVMIEITTDVGLRSCLSNADHTGILLLSANRVLPNGDALCKLGSSSAAHTAHMKSQIVIVLVRHDRIEPATELDSSSSEEGETRQSESKSNKKRRKKKSALERQVCWDDQRHKNEGPHPLIASSLILSWKSMLKSEVVDFVSKKTIIGDSSDNEFFSNSIPTYLNLGFDRVEASWISFYITDSGTIGLERVKEVSRTLTILTRLLWEEEEDFL